MCVHVHVCVLTSYPLRSQSNCMFKGPRMRERVGHWRNWPVSFVEGKGGRWGNEK